MGAGHGARLGVGRGARYLRRRWVRGQGVDDRAEPEFAQNDSRVEERPRSVTRPGYAVVFQVRPDVHDCRAGGPQAECLRDGGRLLPVRFEAPIGALLVPQRHVREWRHSAFDGATLRLRCPLRGCATVILRDEPEHCAGEPARGSIGPNLSDVDREDSSSCLLDPLDNLCLVGQRAEQAVEVGDDNNLGLPVLDELDGAATLALRRGRATCPSA